MHNGGARKLVEDDIRMSSYVSFLSIIVAGAVHGLCLIAGGTLRLNPQGMPGEVLKVRCLYPWVVICTFGWLWTAEVHFLKA